MTSSIVDYTLQIDLWHMLDDEAIGYLEFKSLPLSELLSLVLTPYQTCAIEAPHVLLQVCAVNPGMARQSLIGANANESSCSHVPISKHPINEPIKVDVTNLWSPSLLLVLKLVQEAQVQSEPSDTAVSFCSSQSDTAEFVPRMLMIKGISL